MKTLIEFKIAGFHLTFPFYWFRKNINLIGLRKSLIEFTHNLMNIIKNFKNSSKNKKNNRNKYKLFFADNDESFMIEFSLRTYAFYRFKSKLQFLKCGCKNFTR